MPALVLPGQKIKENLNETFKKGNTTKSGTIHKKRVEVTPTDVSPTENFWMLGPLNKASFGYCASDRCVPTLDRVKHWTSSVGLRYLIDQWGVWPASPTLLTRFIGLAPLFRRMHARPTHRTPPLRSAKARDSWCRFTQSNLNLGMGWFGHGKIAKGHFVQGI
jgi:hypothetical protein